MLVCKSGKAFHVLKSCAGLPGNQNVTITKDSVSSTRNRVQNKFGAGRLPASLYIAKQRKRSILRGWVGRRKLRLSLRGEATVNSNQPTTLSSQLLSFN